MPAKKQAKKKALKQNLLIARDKHGRVHHVEIPSQPIRKLKPRKRAS